MRTADDRDQQGQDRRLVRRLDDQPAGGGRERHPGRRRQPAEERSAARARARGATTGSSRGPAAPARATSRRARRAGTSAGGSGSVTTRSASVDQRRPVRDDDDAAACGRARGRSRRSPARCRSSRWAVGLVEQHPRPVREQHPRQREPGALAGGQGRAVLAERGVQAGGQVADALVERDPAQRVPQRRRRRASGRAEPQVVGDRAGRRRPGAAAAGHLRAPGAAARRAVRRPSAGPRSARAGRRAPRAASTSRSRTGRRPR